jgi:hypothetical protein
VKSKSKHPLGTNIDKFQDTEIESLKFELQNLETFHGELTNEKLELEKLLSEFQHRHTLELGEIILELLNLRKIKFKDDKVRYEETEFDERQYREQVKVEKMKCVYELTKEQKIEIKKKFREATFLCHPDKVSNSFKTIAEAIFIDLKTAYELNDLSRVTEILNDLKKGGFTPRSETVSEKNLLINAITKLQTKVDLLKTQISAIKQSDTYITILEIENWEEYFSRTKIGLQQELEELKKEIETACNDDYIAKAADAQNEKTVTKFSFWSKLKSMWS